MGTDDKNAGYSALTTYPQKYFPTPSISQNCDGLFMNSQGLWLNG